MISLNVFGWYILIATAGISLGLLVKPDPGEALLGEVLGKWAPPSYSKKHVGTEVSRELA
jgi:hypothetical protein